MNTLKIHYIKKAIKNPKNALYVAKVNIDQITGRKLFNNDAGFRHNVLGKISQLKTKKTIDVKENSNQISELGEKGYVSLGIPFKTTDIVNVISKYKQMIENDDYSVVRAEYKNKVYSRMIYQVYKKIPEITNLLTDEIKDMLKEHYKGNFQVHHVLAWRNYHVPPAVIEEKKLFASNWHCDGRDTSRVTLFINLSDVTEDHGPLHVQSKQRTKELIKMGFGGRHNYKLPEDVIEDPNFVVKNIGPPGTSVLCNPQLCLHRAGIPGPNKIRDIMEFRFKPSNQPLDKDWIDKIDEENIAK